MTPHRSWFDSYTSKVIPVRLANDSIIWSAGVGSVRFQPVLDGRLSRQIVFHNVLHVPKLASNLLSLLYLSVHKEYVIDIRFKTISFCRQGDLLFTASINDQNTGYLNGYTVLSSPQSALSTSTCPLDLNLWHRRCSHLNYRDIERMKSQNLVQGFDITSPSSPDPICEPCIGGKQHRHAVPRSASRQIDLLALIHTDLKGPLPKATQEGY